MQLTHAPYVTGARDEEMDDSADDGGSVSEITMQKAARALVDVHDTLNSSEAFKTKRSRPADGPQIEDQKNHGKVRVPMLACHVC